MHLNIFLKNLQARCLQFSKTSPGLLVGISFLLFLGYCLGVMWPVSISKYADSSIVMFLVAMGAQPFIILVLVAWGNHHQLRTVPRLEKYFPSMRAWREWTEQSA